MFFVVLKGHLGKEIFLVDMENLHRIQSAFQSKDKDYEFYSFNPKNLEEEEKFISRKHSTIAGFDVHPENTPKEAMT
jgi:hypothetical protein